MLSDGSFFQTIKPVIEIAAIIIGGLWTYDRLIRYREHYPYFEISHHVDHLYLKDKDFDSGYFFLRVWVIVSNKGKVKLDLSNAITFVRQVLPLVHPVLKELKASEENTERIRNREIEGLFLDKELGKISWPKLDSRKWEIQDDSKNKKLSLEPGQTKVFPLDFLIENAIKVVEIVSYLDKGKSEINCWADPPTSTLYDFERGEKN